jgi:hypothetical protein
MGDRIMTLHPDGKSGVNIDRVRYETIRAAILAAVGEAGEIGFTELIADVQHRLAGRFAGSVPWYVTTVKLDLEARGLLERGMVGGRQVLRRTDRA